MNRRRFTTLAVGAGVAGTLAALGLEGSRAESEAAVLPDRPLPVPSNGFVRTAVAIGPGVNVIDLSGPWEVFQDAAVAQAGGQFELFSVAESTGAIDASGGLRVDAAYSYETAPQPNLVVVPAHDSSERTLAWLRRISRRAYLVMSVCTGAFVVAEAGLLDGKTATTHHQSWTCSSCRTRPFACSAASGSSSTSALRLPVGFRRASISRSASWSATSAAPPPMPPPSTWSTDVGRCPSRNLRRMEGSGGFFPFGGGDPEDLLGALREFAERQAETVQETQREQFATLTLNTAVELTSAALGQMQVEGPTDAQALALRDAMRVLFPEAVALVSAARQGFMRQ